MTAQWIAPGEDDTAELNGSGPGDHGPGFDAEGYEAAIRTAVEQRKYNLRIERLAQAELAAESVVPVPPAFNGAEFLAQPDDEPVYRIADLWPAGGNIVLAAQFKAGKTTMTHNLLRCLCDGTPFLGRYRVDPPPGGVFLIDAEMASRSARRWLGDHMITRAYRFTYQNVRGAAASFNILLPDVRARWADRIRASGASVVILDCLGPVLAAIGLEENSTSDVGRFLEAFTELLRDAGISEAAVIHHMGHVGERSRGASRLRDWPDAEWRLVRLEDDPNSPRYLSAFGRDVDVPESRLEFDPETRALRIEGGSRKGQKIADALQGIIKAVDAEPGINSSELERALVDTGMHTQNVVRSALGAALRGRYVIRRDGPRRSKVHYIGPIAVQEGLASPQVIPP